MKQFYLLVCIALLINTQTQAQTTQDTIYFWKGGVLNLKKSIKAADLDSLTFKRPTVVVVVPIATVTIGTQTWQAKNLNVTTYRNGDVIPEVQDASAWASLTTGAWCHYNNDPANDAIYGKLYNWYAVNDSRGLAPTGFHVPTDTELTAVTDMKDPARFAGLPGGYRDSYGGAFYYIGSLGYWWSSSENDTANAWYRYLDYYSGNAFSYATNKTYGFSVRCLVDAVAPTITTTAVSSIGTTTASSGGVITADGGASVRQRGLVWSTSTNPTIALSTKTQDGTGTGTYTSALSGLIGNTTYYVRAYATNSAGIGYGAEVSFATLAPPTEVVIGTQTWQDKNLNVTTYRNGDVIPEVQGATDWESLTIGAWCHYNNDPANDAIYGKLYNWYAVNDSRGLAPSGFHVPTDTELTAVTNMKDTAGFAGLPGGYRGTNGTFSTIGNLGFWWSSTEYGTTNAWSRYLSYDFGSAFRNGYNKKEGFSVRCLRD